MDDVKRIVIIGGGPGGYEAALVAARLGAEVTLVDSDGLGGAAVLTDCVPSKTLIATAEAMASFEHADELGIRIGGQAPGGSCVTGVNLEKVNRRVKSLAEAQSVDIGESLVKAGVNIVRGHGSLAGERTVEMRLHTGEVETVTADVVLIATGV